MEEGAIKLIDIEEEIKSSYLDYAMSVIVSRALPDARDGLKPVQRRILYAMDELGLRHTGPHKKSARIVGEVMGKYHPHGDAPIYEAMVRMAQDFSMREMLVDGQGNFGSVDNDPPAAMRYTEARLSRIAEEMLLDIDKNTVDFIPNFDASLREPTVLPARLPNLLVNGSSGIAVGMATNIPPHNLGEVCGAIAYLIDNPQATVEELLQFVRGPDFPTAALLLGQEGIKNAYATGHGKIVLRARVAYEEGSKGGRRQIVVTELPYQTNKAALVQRIAELVKEKRVEGVSEVRDESDRQGMRLVIELKREAQPERVLNSLYKYTAMQSTFFINMLALVEGQPRVLGLKEALNCHIDFRHEVITRRSQFDLERARERAHILEGLKIALDRIDEVIAIIRGSESTDHARQALMADLGVSQVQAQAILDLQLRRLANLERRKIIDEYAELLRTISYLEDLLANPRKIHFLIKEDVAELKSKYGNPRRTEISEEEVVEFRDEDLIPHQRVLVTLSNRGYVKRLPWDTYRLQQRGGRGVIGMATGEADVVRLSELADTHDNLLFFTSRGKVYRLHCYEISPDSSRVGKGTPLVNLLPIDTKERVTAMVAVTDFTPDNFLVLASCQGEVKKARLGGFSSVRSNGLIAMDLEPRDELVAAALVSDEDKIILVSQSGRAIKFAVKTLRTASRTSGGVRGIHLAPSDRVVSMDVVFPSSYLLTVTSKGFGKRSPIDRYPLQARGGRGVRCHRVGDKTGGVVAAQLVSSSEEVTIISTGGIVIRTSVEEISIQSRATKGVHVMKMDEGDVVASIACLRAEARKRP